MGWKTWGARSNVGPDTPEYNEKDRQYYRKGGGCGMTQGERANSRGLSTD
jgi:hypothetical protein